MNTRQLGILALLAAASVAATAVVMRTGTAGIASDRRGEPVLPDVIAKANNFSGLTVNEDGAPLAIERKDAGFVAADSGYPIKTDAVRDLLASSIALTFEEARTSDPARYADLGLADPGAADAGKEITFRAGGADLADIVVGKPDGTVGGPVGGVFVRLKPQPQTWLVRGNVRLPSGRADWFASLDLGASRTAIRKIELSGGGRDGVTATAGKPGELTLDNVPDKRVPDTFKVGRLTTLVDSFAFQDVRKRSKPGDDPRRMLVDLNDGLRLVITSVGDLNEGWVQISAEATNDASRAKADALAAKVQAYDFRLPIDRATLIGSTASELTNEQKG